MANNFKKALLLGLVGITALTGCAKDNNLAGKNNNTENVDAKTGAAETKEDIIKKEEAAGLRGTYDDVKKFIDEKGVDEITIADFEHIEHEDIGSGFQCYMYNLEDGKLLLSTVNNEEHPFAVTLIDKDGNEIPLKTDYSALERIDNKEETVEPADVNTNEETDKNNDEKADNTKTTEQQENKESEDTKEENTEEENTGDEE